MKAKQTSRNSSKVTYPKSVIRIVPTAEIIQRRIPNDCINCKWDFSQRRYANGNYKLAPTGIRVRLKFISRACPLHANVRCEQTPL